MENHESHKLTGIDAIFNFILGGIAIFTIVNTLTGRRFTFKVTKKDVGDGKTLFFVGVLSGPDNGADYNFLGTIFDDGVYRHGKKSRIGQDAMSAKAFAWLMGRLETRTDLGPVEFWHEGRCARCGRRLTTVESIKSGFGPVCLEKLAA
jgi:hypothetical protein